MNRDMGNMNRDMGNVNRDMGNVNRDMGNVNRDVGNMNRDMGNPGNMSNMSNMNRDMGNPGNMSNMSNMNRDMGNMNRGFGDMGNMKRDSGIVTSRVNSSDREMNNQGYGKGYEETQGNMGMMRGDMEDYSHNKDQGGYENTRNFGSASGRFESKNEGGFEQRMSSHQDKFNQRQNTDSVMSNRDCHERGFNNRNIGAGSSINQNRIQGAEPELQSYSAAADDKLSMN